RRHTRFSRDWSSDVCSSDLQAQRMYASLNYTHAARTLADRGLNCIVQKVAASDDGSRLSLSCNTDLTFDAVDALAGRGLPPPLRSEERRVGEEATPGMAAEP